MGDVCFAHCRTLRFACYRTAEPTGRSFHSLQDASLALVSSFHSLESISVTFYIKRPPPFRSVYTTLHSELRRNEDVAPLARHGCTFSTSYKYLATPPRSGDSAFLVGFEWSSSVDMHIFVCIYRWDILPLSRNSSPEDRYIYEAGEADIMIKSVY